MTDEGIAEVYALARESFSAGQKGFQFQAYPFRMTAENLAKFRHDPNMPYWRNLKEGNDVFEVTKREAKVAVCGGRYAFNTVGEGCAPDPTLAPVLAEKDEKDRHEVAELVAKGTPAVRVVYADGGQHETFRQTSLAAFGGDTGFAVLDSRERRNLGDVSRPDALAMGPQEIPIDAPATSAGRGATVLAAATTSRKPVAATKVANIRAASEPAPIVVAKAEPQTTASAQERPFHQRVLGGLFGSGEPAPAATAPASVEAPADSSPLPPRRKSVSVAPAKIQSAPAQGATKPQASRAAKPDRHAAVSGFVRSAAYVGPTPGGFARN
jgi:hypothetical protein